MYAGDLNHDVQEFRRGCSMDSPQPCGSWSWRHAVRKNDQPSVINCGIKQVHNVACGSRPRKELQQLQCYTQPVIPPPPLVQYSGCCSGIHTITMSIWRTKLGPKSRRPLRYIKTVPHSFVYPTPAAIDPPSVAMYYDTNLQSILKATISSRASSDGR